MASGRAPALLALLLLSAAAALAVPACGARTPLRVLGDVVGSASDAFCGHADYEVGSREVSIYVLLDVSESMTADGKWGQASSALTAFANAPEAAGLALGLQYFPLGGSCDVSKYTLPAVPVAELPGNAAAIEASLAAHYPDWGDTPTWPALRGGVEYARALLLGDPDRAVVVALVTDGAPNACGSTTDSVALVAADGANAAPQVRTFVIGLESGYVDDMNKIAAAGGTGEAVLIGAGPDSGQRIVEALQKVRSTAAGCTYSVPAVGVEEVRAADVTVTVDALPAGSPVGLARVAGLGACGQAPAFFADAEEAATSVRLCPALCDELQAGGGVVVRVTAGCGGSSDAPGPPPTTDDCSGAVSFQCVATCGGESSLPICVNATWTCPEGKVPNDTCSTCSAIPHGCCLSDGTLGVASCIAGEWVCPPGAAIFGSPGCIPPEVCAALLPCPVGSYCQVGDYTCGLGNVPGTCLPVPAGCSSGGPLACGCDGAIHESACGAAALGLDVTTESCSEPAGTFRCGPLFCPDGIAICKKTLDLTEVLTPETFECIGEPAGCPTGCGCGACQPCPTGKVCTESCTQQGSARYLTCTQL